MKGIMDKDPDFIFNIGMPVYIPSEEEIEAVGGMLEAHLNFLIENKYATKEEIVAYIKFGSLLAASSTFLLDNFLEQYRKHEIK